MHGISKLVAGPGQIINLMTQHSLPPALAYLVYVGEVVAPLLLIVGLWSRVAALIVVINMIIAVLLVHTAQLPTLNPMGGWALELQGFYLFTAIAIALLGAGSISLGGRNGALN
jgi:putative oxidoreductase